MEKMSFIVNTGLFASHMIVALAAIALWENNITTATVAVVMATAICRDAIKHGLSCVEKRKKK